MHCSSRLNRQVWMERMYGIVANPSRTSPDRILVPMLRQDIATNFHETNYKILLQVQNSHDRKSAKREDRNIYR